MAVTVAEAVAGTAAGALNSGQIFSRLGAAFRVSAENRLLQAFQQISDFVAGRYPVRDLPERERLSHYQHFRMPGLRSACLRAAAAEEQ
jgi:hypothetical protein